MFWQQKYLLSLPEVAQLDQAQRSGVVASGLMWIMFGSLIGNFVAGALARYLGYKLALFFMMFAYFLSMFVCFYWQWDLVAVKWHFANIGLWQGVFGLFTMCLPPLFPVLIRTTGAGFCYNVGRIFAAIGTVVFSLAPSAKVNNYQEALFYAGFLFVPAALLSLMLPHEKETL
jgi:MFS family permease